MQKKSSPSKPLSAEPGRAIDLLEKMSELLKHQRRHFDDAVVIHCIRLINEYADDGIREDSKAQTTAPASNQRT